MKLLTRPLLSRSGQLSAIAGAGWQQAQPPVRSTLVCTR
jgi:hypothetical protein